MSSTVFTPTPAVYPDGRSAFNPQEEEGDANSTRTERWGGGPPVAPSTEARTATCEVEVVKRLLARESREPWTRVQLERAIRSNPLDLSDALHNLAAVGLIRLSEARVTLTPDAHDSMLYLRSML